MGVNLSIKNVPDHLAQRLRSRAAHNHRSLQGELMAILEEALQPKKLTVDDVYEKITQLDFSTPDTSVEMIREDRNER